MQTVQCFKLSISDPSQIGDARRQAVDLTDSMGFDENYQGNLAIVVTELASNLVKHAQEGELIVQRQVDGPGIEVLAIDRGPGMRDVGQCMEDGYSTAGSRGVGLGAIRRLSTHWEAFTQPGVGTVQLARYLPLQGSERRQDTREMGSGRLPTGGLSVPAPGQTVCGDAWAVEHTPGGTRVLVVDGLGHGSPAAIASREAVAAFQGNPKSIADVLADIHEALRPTRGAAAAIVEVRHAAGEVRYAGVGNISAFVSSPAKTQNLVSVNGTLGAGQCRFREFVYSIPASATVILFSDGLISQTRLDSYGGLVGCDPTVIAAVLYRDFRRGRDDATVVAVSVP